MVIWSFMQTSISGLGVKTRSFKTGSLKRETGPHHETRFGAKGSVQRVKLEGAAAPHGSVMAELVRSRRYEMKYWEIGISQMQMDHEACRSPRHAT
jgi:hypothetical protein